MPTLKQLRYLVAIGETLHFRRAAESVHVSQPTLSAQLKELEDRLGVQLVERSRSRVILTPIGSAVATRASGILRDVQDIVDMTKIGQSMLGGVIRVGFLPTLGPYLMPIVLEPLRQSFPHLRLYPKEGMPDRLQRMLEEGNLDLLIFPLPVRGHALRSERLFREPLSIVASKEHPLAASDTVDYKALAGQTVLALETGHRLHDQVRDLCDQHGAYLSLDYDGTSLDTLRHMVAMGFGISLMPSLYVRSEVSKDPSVRAISLGRRAPMRTIGMVWREHSARGDEYMTLANAIRDILRDKSAGVQIVS
ncbi:MAG: LysR substrate-binding domain-containing protein [Rhodospirillales bacterium]|nr:LysR substrate-binding domain-containing protein [Rhodospirillales bacterium]